MGRYKRDLVNTDSEKTKPTCTKFRRVRIKTMREVKFGRLSVYLEMLNVRMNLQYFYLEYTERVLRFECRKGKRHKKHISKFMKNAVISGQVMCHVVGTSIAIGGRSMLVPLSELRPVLSAKGNFDNRMTGKGLLDRHFVNTFANLDVSEGTKDACLTQIKKTETETPRSQTEILEGQGMQGNGQRICEPQGPQGSHDNDVINSSDVLEEHQPESINYPDTHDVNEQVPPGTSIQWSHAENHGQETGEEEEETAPVQEIPETAATENDGEQNVQAGISSVPEWLKKITKIQTPEESRRENLEISKGIFVQEWQALNEIQAFEILDEFETNLLLCSWLVRGIRPHLLEEQLRFELRRHLQEARVDAEIEIQDWIMNKSGQPYLDRRNAFLQHQSQKMKKSLRETFELDNVY
ncbi:uncharacterized protein LOC106179732 [Lingula anatina]|uniref:Uncharacterized protein LOC106179732 n=1 Tax=Lingula anatina TaxID=7574 RepID=A0A1S3K9H6_LINAN|nr:uncharacterized protein LOC106179732 [Lingula anatina]|eukprot:XP_013418911.1 uncharacterized protein LOC106179732 [Lingula anatina]